MWWLIDQQHLNEASYRKCPPRFSQRKAEFFAGRNYYLAGVRIRVAEAGQIKFIAVAPPLESPAQLVASRSDAGELIHDSATLAPLIKEDIDRVVTIADGASVGIPE